MANDDKKASSQTQIFLPKRSRKLATLAKAARQCRGCDLYLNAEQVVFGEGDPSARIMVVGEQPGDEEDKAGRPFIGPAGRLLRKALSQAGFDSKKYYITNAVKHFRWVKTSGKRRIHQKPGVVHVNACRPWLIAEQEAVKPELIICLGTTAARAVLERDASIKDVGYRFLKDYADCEVLVLNHPSALIRIREQPARKAAFDKFVDWLEQAKVRVYGSER
jgi:uracil-DNA glycosylase